MSAGVHGNETAPIELLNQLVGDLLIGRLPLTVRLLVVLGNPAAMRAEALSAQRHEPHVRQPATAILKPPAARPCDAQQLERALAAFRWGTGGAFYFRSALPSVNRGCHVSAFCLSRNARTVSRC